MIKYVSLIIVFLFYLSDGFSDTKIPGQLNFSIGSVSGSFAENPDSLKSTDGSTSTATTPYSGTASSMPLEIGYEYFPNLKRSYIMKGAGPIMGSTPDRYFSFSAGLNFYFTEVGAQAKVSDFNFEMKIIPKLRYYAGPSLGLGYLVYNTKSSTKNDVLFEVGGQGGVIYSINNKWGVRGEIAAARAIGVLVSSTIIKILIGASYTVGM